MIPASAIEAAAKALHSAECGWDDWDMIHQGRGSYLTHARLALEAAAPLMASGRPAIEAVREAHERGWPVHSNSGGWDESGRAIHRYVIYTDWQPDPSRPDRRTP